MGFKARRRVPAGARFDRKGLYRALDAKRREHDYSWREVARQAGLNDMILVRLARGQGPTVESYGKLVTWLGVGPATFFR